MATPNPAASAAYGVSAGLDLLSGVFGFLTAQSNASIARSRADMVRLESEANAQRYAEQAAQFEAHEKVMYLSSGVKLAGSPVDALATTARIAHENIQSILMGGEARAMDSDIAGTNSEIQGRDALVGGFGRAIGLGAKSYLAFTGKGDGT